MITHERLCELVRYDPDTGLFYSLANRGQSFLGKPLGARHSRGYIRIMLDYKEYLAHRLAFLYMEGRHPDNEVDHINGNKTDNRWVNLRAATRSQNSHNMYRHPLSNTNIKGVTKTPYGTFRAHVKCQNKEHSKSFKALDDAVRWATKKRDDLHKEYAQHALAAAPRNEQGGE